MRPADPSRKPAEPAIIGFRVEKPLRDEFEKICREKDITASQVMRKFLREFIRENGNGKLIEQ